MANSTNDSKDNGIGGISDPGNLGVSSLYTTAQAKEFLGVCDVTLWRLRKNREITHYRVGGKLYYPVESLSMYLESNKCAAIAAAA